MFISRVAKPISALSEHTHAAEVVKVQSFYLLGARAFTDPGSGEIFISKTLYSIRNPPHSGSIVYLEKVANQWGCQLQPTEYFT